MPSRQQKNTKLRCCVTVRVMDCSCKCVPGTSFSPSIKVQNAKQKPHYAKHMPFFCVWPMHEFSAHVHTNREIFLGHIHADKLDTQKKKTILPQASTWAQTLRPTPRKIQACNPTILTRLLPRNEMKHKTPCHHNNEMRNVGRVDANYKHIHPKSVWFAQNDAAFRRWYAPTVKRISKRKRRFGKTTCVVGLLHAFKWPCPKSKWLIGINIFALWKPMYRAVWDGRKMPQDCT